MASLAAHVAEMSDAENSAANLHLFFIRSCSTGAAKYIQILTCVPESFLLLI